MNEIAHPYEMGYFFKSYIMIIKEIGIDSIKDVIGIKLKINKLYKIWHIEHYDNIAKYRYISEEHVQLPALIKPKLKEL
jgi:hypothetical protein